VKLSNILNEQEAHADDVPPGLTPEQEAAWPTMHPLAKNKILHNMVVAMMKDHTEQNHKMARDTDDFIRRHKEPSALPRTRAEARGQYD